MLVEKGQKGPLGGDAVLFAAEDMLFVWEETAKVDSFPHFEWRQMVMLLTPK